MEFSRPPSQIVPTSAGRQSNSAGRWAPGDRVRRSRASARRAGGIPSDGRCMRPGPDRQAVLAEGCIARPLVHRQRQP